MSMRGGDLLWRGQPLTLARPGRKRKPSAPLRMGRRVRPRLTGKRRVPTRTRTRRRKRRLGRAVKRGDNSSASFCSFGKRWLKRGAAKLLAGMSGKKCIATHSSGNLSSAQRQQATGFYDWMSKADCTAIKTEANGGTASDSHVSYLMRYMKGVLTVKNQSNHVVKVKLYDLVCKRPPAGTSVDNPTEAWQKWYTDAGASGTITNEVGNSPLRSQEFLKYFSVKRFICHDLEPGETHTHTVYQGYNRLIRDFDISETTNVSIPYMTGYVMFTIHGSIGHESATPGNVSYMPATIDFTWRKELVFQHATQVQPKYTLTNNLPATVTNFDAMLENQDVDLDPVAA